MKELLLLCAMGEWVVCASSSYLVLLDQGVHPFVLVPFYVYDGVCVCVCVCV